MNKNLILFFLSVLLLPLSSSGQISFVNGDNAHDFGQIARGDSAKHRFEFANNGNEALTITKVSSTDPHMHFRWSRKPIKPGKRDAIVVSYVTDREDNAGSFQSDVLVYFHSMPNAYPLFSVKGTIVPFTPALSPKSSDTARSINIPISKSAREKREKKKK